MPFCILLRTSVASMGDFLALSAYLFFMYYALHAVEMRTDEVIRTATMQRSRGIRKMLY